MLSFSSFIIYLFNYLSYQYLFIYTSSYLSVIMVWLSVRLLNELFIVLWIVLFFCLSLVFLYFVLHLNILLFN